VLLLVTSENGRYMYRINMVQRYFSDKEEGPKTRKDATISHEAWGGIVALINSLINKEAFAVNFPVKCDDGAGVIGTNAENMTLA